MISEKRKKELNRIVNAYSQKAHLNNKSFFSVMNENGLLIRSKRDLQKAPIPPVNDEELLYVERERNLANMRDGWDMMPDARRGKANLQQNRNNAPKGGKATAHYTDLHFTLSFSQYREKQLDKSAWDASHSLTRKGQPLDRYKQGSAYKRLERMAAKEGVSVPEYYENL